MAEASTYSEQTNLIIERLKAEGQLLRNTGTNSIRSVKIQLDRFENIFNSISSNIAEQSSSLKQSLTMSEERFEIQKRQSDLADLERQEEKQSNDPPMQERERGPSLLSRGRSFFDSIMKFVGSFAGMGFKLLLGAGGLFAAYNFAKGYIDEKTGGGFTKFEDSMIKVFTDVDWEKAGIAFIDFAKKIPEALESIVKFVTDPLTWIIGAAGAAALIVAIKAIPGVVTRALVSPLGLGALAAGAIKAIPGVVTRALVSPLGLGALAAGGTALMLYDAYKEDTRLKELRNKKQSGNITAEEQKELSTLEEKRAEPMPASPDDQMVLDAIEENRRKKIQAQAQQTSQETKDFTSVLNEIDTNLSKGIVGINQTQRLKLQGYQNYFTKTMSSILSDNMIDMEEQSVVAAMNPAMQRIAEIRKKYAGDQKKTQFLDNLLSPTDILNKNLIEGTQSGRFKVMPPESSTAAVQNKIDQSAIGGGTMPPVVVHNAPVIAPQVSNVTKGGSTMNNTTVLSTGGGSSSSAFPGIPSALN